MPESLLVSRSAGLDAVETISIADMTARDLRVLSATRKWSLSVEDLAAVRGHFKTLNRHPTAVELEVIAQTWSEHCKHRIFNAGILHSRGRQTESIDGLFQTYIKGVTERIRARKPDFVLGAFDDNAGFVRVDETTAACLKVETHNHPSAIDPYCGSNTGLGGVIRDILGAGKGGKPVAALDVFCFGMPDTAAELSIHPVGIFRGAVRGVRDYGNRMGIPTVAGAIHFDAGFACNPLVFCGTAGLIPVRDIPKKVYPGLKIIVAGARTGRDGLHGATFSSESLTAESRVEDRQAVQIGNPIEEKKLTNFILTAREEGLVEFITDCGAGGLSSAVGEMVRETGGKVVLDPVPLKEEGLAAWEIFLSESQERMVLGVREKHLGRLAELAGMFESECAEIGEVTGTKSLEVFHQGVQVCSLDCGFLHAAPRKRLVSEYTETIPATDDRVLPSRTPAHVLKDILADVNIASREPVIRQYDFEVQGNTVLKPLAGPGGDNPQDGVGIRVDGSAKCIALGVSLLPQYGVWDAYRMGESCVDEAVRQVVVAGANPDKIALLDNFCAGNPDDPAELGRLVECVKAIGAVSETYQTPIISGKDSFYNCFTTGEGKTVSIPVTVLMTAMGIVDRKEHLTASFIRKSNSVICLVGQTMQEMAGSAFQRKNKIRSCRVPGVDAVRAFESYRRFYTCVREGLVLSAHDLSEGGLGVALCEMAFSLQGGLEIDLDRVSRERGMNADEILFSESCSRILIEVDESNVQAVQVRFAGLSFSKVGRTVDGHRRLVIRAGSDEVGSGVVLDEPLNELKQIWKNGLTRYC